MPARASWTTRSGSLTPGKQADIVLLKTDVINTAPVLDPTATIVTFADTANVDSVFVAGNAVKRGGQLVGVDMKSVVQRLEASSNHILGEGGLLPDWCKESAGAPRSTLMPSGSVVVVGGTRGLGRELAQFYADQGRDVVITGRDQTRAEACAAEIGGSTRGIGLDLAEPHTIAEQLADVGDVAHLVLAAIERDSNSVKDYDIACGDAARDAEARRLHRGDPRAAAAARRRLRRSSSSAGSRAIGRIRARRPSRPSTAGSPASCARS